MSKTKDKKAQRAETGKDELIVRQAARIESLEEVQRVGKVYVEELLKAGGVLRDQISTLEEASTNLQNTIDRQRAEIQELNVALCDEREKLAAIRRSVEGQPDPINREQVVDETVATIFG